MDFRGVAADENDALRGSLGRPTGLASVHKSAQYPLLMSQINRAQSFPKRNVRSFRSIIRRFDGRLPVGESSSLAQFGDGDDTQKKRCPRPLRRAGENACMGRLSFIGSDRPRSSQKIHSQRCADATDRALELSREPRRGE